MPLAMNVELKESIEEKVNLLGGEAYLHKGLILTETDLQCALYRKLYEIEELVTLEYTADEEAILSHTLHTEITWFDVNGQLRIRPDITLMKPESLTILTGANGTPLPSKGFESVNGGIIFELKFDRNKRTIAQQTMEGVFKDIRNYGKLLNKFDNQGMIDEMYAYFILFIKSSDNETNQNKIHEINQTFITYEIPEDKYKFIYRYIEV